MQFTQAMTSKGRGSTFYVTGDTGLKYIVHFKRHNVKHRRVWTCDCPDFTERQVFSNGTCKHIDFVIRETGNSIPGVNSVLPQGQIDAPKPTVKSVLADVVAMLNSPDERSGWQLWAVLTALRGPDNNNCNLKNLTTASIRGILGLQDNRGGGFVVTDKPPIEKDTPDYLIYDKLVANHGKVDYHFACHYANAITALKQLGML